MPQPTPPANCGAQPLALWEKALMSLILIATLIHYSLMIQVIYENWALFREVIETGTIPLILMPITLLPALGTFLLLRRSRWSLPAYAAHILVSLAYAGLRTGFADLHWLIPAGYAFEITVIFFIVHLLGRGALR